MSDKKFKPIFESTLSEQSALLKSQLQQVQRENLKAGLYNSYRDARYKAQNILVRRYKDRREIVQIDAATGHTQTIKTIL
ncbi:MULTISPECIES: hypothetical protein [unclassified Mucilaginibacter]|uniref:hypothetical protein n=1 Tax=unclassified Mucilaginibacter TaxID=2617802 RepID=UPI0009595C07|nr:MULTISPECIES: hypothetical protein [unclassified Mucilaginibacter]OJW16508.1 MAG: hypothetical protein BGO48_10065 [Mucilaginibacter sp. 44-25]PLW90572.1 MAG: hypothetical protein C0154_05745 [Mucilaginibacter sp.]PMP65124.1 MAG: hypothetical protein C0191_04475 [Mucilaginibacter sp.]HEK21775.1 hypothetical protein [Bacteroidota bacterium]